MTSETEESRRILTILKNDSTNLFMRLKDRRVESLQILSLKRSREHFKDLFKSFYHTSTIEHIKKCSTDLIMALDNFYTEIEKYQWYLSHTEDMPAMLEDKTLIFESKVETSYEMLNMYLNAELGVIEERETKE